METKKPNTKLISLGVLVAVVLLVVAVSAINKKDTEIDSVATTDTTSQIASETTQDSTSDIDDSGDDATDDSKTTAATTPPTTTTPTAPAAAPPATSAYKAGTYSADGSYQTPEGQESIGIAVTISGDGTITSTSATPEGKSQDSKQYQAQFIGGYKSKVVGKNIATLKLGNVSGSSLTPIGFNKAIAIISTQAKS